MFEGLVASIFNKWLGKYVEDLDTEQLNVGIFGGEVKLQELKLKPEALFELQLPIEVKYGVIGAISLTIPWTNLSSKAIVINVEDVLVVGVPIGTGEFSHDKERRLIRAMKKKILDDIEGENFLGGGPGSLYDDIIMALTNNIQISIQKIHVRYEDENCNRGIACGLCIERLSMETTNSKWKSCEKSTGSSMVYQLGKLEAASIYFNTDLENGDFLSESWREDLKLGLEMFSVNEKSFDFGNEAFPVTEFCV
ncbi:hypothetical protein RUM43_010577 [Polyplax serrata]|uniref:Chorein N-terminal domain-containing protein n=1 Tax=Polyplax serrata TaxID=468196 RepID=A0AAN8S854_POLSC